VPLEGIVYGFYLRRKRRKRAKSDTGRYCIRFLFEKKRMKGFVMQRFHMRRKRVKSDTGRYCTRFVYEKKEGRERSVTLEGTVQGFYLRRKKEGRELSCKDYEKEESEE
jgi:hypothetical protein